VIHSHKVRIAVATYKRNDLLKDLLDSLAAAHAITPFRVLIVDNDPEGGARKICQRKDLQIDYAVEDKPGIAAARNRALDMLEPEDAAIVFVDDDERVDTNWLRHLLALMNDTSADVVAGPVISVFPKDAPEWIVRGGFHQRVRFATGTELESAATNNTIVRTAFLRSMENPRFDESFSATGGSDTDFFYRLRQRGARMLWCDEAIVSEDVPANRLSFRWIWRRGVRIGNVTGRLRLRESGRIQLLVGAALRIAYGSCLIAISLCRGKGLRAAHFDYVVRGVGWFGASANVLVQEYRR
jgi:succinoglycan biosynthesis protein ExoM